MTIKRYIFFSSNSNFYCHFIVINSTEVLETNKQTI